MDIAATAASSLNLDTLWLVLTGIGVPVVGFVAKSLFTMLKGHSEKLDAIEKRQADFEVKVAENYISTDRFVQFEQRVLQSIGDVSKKIDSMFFNYNRHKGE